MLVELGNPDPVVCVFDDNGNHINHRPLGLGAPAVTYVHVPEATRADGSAIYGFDDAVDINAMARHLLSRTDGISHLPGHEALLTFLSPAGLGPHHFGPGPSWVRSDHAGLAAKLSEFYECPILDVEDHSFEDTHFSVAGPPGVVPGANINLQANITQNGRDIWARNLGGNVVGATGTTSATAPTATTLTSTATWTTNQWAGCRIFATTTTAGQMVWGNIVSNTNAAGASVATVDRWYTPSTPGGTAGTTPVASGQWVIMDGGSPAWFMGLSTSTTALASPSTNTSLPSEYTVAGGGLIRQICPYAHTASANTYTLTPVFTANSNDTSSLPITIGSIGVFNSMVVGDTTSTMLFNTLLSTTATISASGDQLTITETVTGT